MKDPLDTFFDYSPDLLCILEEGGRFVRINLAFSRMLGWTKEDRSTRSYLETIHPGDAEYIQRIFNRLKPDGRQESFDIRCRCADSSYQKVRWTVFKKGKMIFCRGQEQSGTGGSFDLYQVLIDNSPTGMVLVDHRGVISIANREAGRIFGYAPEELAGQPIELLLPRSLKATHRGHREAYTRQPETRPMGTGRDLVGQRKNGQPVEVEIGLNPVQTAQGTMVLSTIIDLTDRKRSEKSMVDLTERLEESIQELSQLASTDSLTGLKNRRAFNECFNASLQGMVQVGDRISLLLLDIDNFKGYNDSFGHPAGDRLLIEVAQLLQQSSRANDFIARIGGEEFAIILPGTGVEAAGRIARRYLRTFKEKDWPLKQVTGSIGVASHTFDLESPPDPQALADRLYQGADQALYQSKANGKNQSTLIAV